MSPTGKRPTVLVVDDTEANLDLLVDILQESYEVAAAIDGQSALELAAETPPDLVLLDIMMPGMDGHEVCRRLKAEKKTAAIPVIFITAKSDPEDQARGFRLGAVDYIAKPISPPVVLARAATHLKLHRQAVELARQNKSLKEYARLRDEVERITQHDLKTPLNAVTTVPAMLMEEPNLTPDQRELLEMLAQSGRRMLQIINGSLDLYKMETGRYQLAPEPVDLIGVLCQIRGETREMMAAKNLTPLFMFSGRPVEDRDVVWVWGEETLLYSMMANLLKNAVEASPEGQNITFSLEKGEMVHVRLHNKGAVPAAIRETFFEKFTTAGKEGGTGLGTYAARLISHTMGGHIAMRSSEVEGTLITVQLPLSREEGEVKPRPHFAPPATDHKTTARQAPAVDLAAVFAGKPAAPGRFRLDPNLAILVVDDYANMRRITKSTLRRMGYGNVSEAENGEVALRLATGQKFGLIISDVNMPKMNGLELLRELRSRPETSGVPFILVTGEADQETVLAAAKSKVNSFILKPYSPDNLKGKIEKALSTH